MAKWKFKHNSHDVLISTKRTDMRDTIFENNKSLLGPSLRVDSTFTISYGGHVITNCSKSVRLDPKNQTFMPSIWKSFNGLNTWKEAHAQTPR
jgi:hypothetical protein